MPSSIIVIGAGIAGLAAAHRLAAQGVNVTVLEAEDRPGGRMSTDMRDGWRIDRGAQFLSSGYRVIPELIQQCGLSAQLRLVTPWSATVSSGRIHRLNAHRPWTLIGSGLFGFMQFARLGWWSALDGLRTRTNPLNDYAAWCDWDDEDAAAWAVRRFGEKALEYLFEPMLQGFYFQSPEETSRALAMLLWNFGTRGTHTMALTGGMQMLPQALAEGLDVRLSTPATKLECRADGVYVETPQGCLRGDRVILATTASKARQLYQPDNPAARQLLETRYSSTIMIGIGLSEGLNVEPVPVDVYGVLIPRRERRVIAAVAIESRKSPDRVSRGELLNVMLDGVAGARLVDADEADVMAEVLPELETWFPGVRRHIGFTHFCRWREAEPYSPIGRSRVIDVYRKSCCTDQAVVLAGDYLGIPTTEGAAHSGMWAADFLLAQI
ncbi:MAG: FAD-dependent oxidoreductase [Rhodanobacter sp.]|jgi:oxygen-dependent protoporphyrinogen oxidase|nr:FAD-dependent oxidoreductase [Rhodanobacter sp.]